MKDLWHLPGLIFSAAVFLGGAGVLAQTNEAIPKEKNTSSHKIFGPVNEQGFTNTIELGFVSGDGGKGGADQNVSLVSDFAREQFDAGDFHYMAGDGFYGVDMKLIRLARADWSDLEAKQLAAALTADAGDAKRPKFLPEAKEQGKYGFQVYHKSIKLPALDSDAPATYGFRTSHGVMGLLQIRRLTNNSAGVTIRYKLVQSRPQIR
jgi:hypothetical protein